MRTRMQIPASELIAHSDDSEGDFLPGLGNGYVVEVTEGNGYLAYPLTGWGADCAMPDDTLVVTFHDASGNENYLLLTPDCMVTVERS